MVAKLSRDFLFPVELGEGSRAAVGLMGQLMDGISGAAEGPAATLTGKPRCKWLRLQLNRGLCLMLQTTLLRYNV